MPIIRFGGGGGSPGGAPNTVIRQYAPGVLLLDPVYQRADGLMDRADASGLPQGQVIGVANSMDNPNPGDVLVCYTGDVGGFVGLVPGALYILGTVAGTYVRSDDTGNPNYPSAPGQIVFELGIASSATNLFVNTTRDFHMV